MAISLDKETKSKVTLEKESKSGDLTWEDAAWSWEEDDSTWEAPKVSLSKETKSKVTLDKELRI